MDIVGLSKSTISLINGEEEYLSVIGIGIQLILSPLLFKEEQTPPNLTSQPCPLSSCTTPSFFLPIGLARKNWGGGGGKTFGRTLYFYNKWETTLRPDAANDFVRQIIFHSYFIPK